MLEWEWANFYSVSGKKGMENCAPAPFEVADYSHTSN